MHRIGLGLGLVFGAMLDPGRGTIIQSDFVLPASKMGVAATEDEVSKADSMDDQGQGFPQICKRIRR